MPAAADSFWELAMNMLLNRGASALALVALGCSSSGADDEARVELLTWWKQPSELDAIHAAIDVHRLGHPDVQIKVHTSDTQGTLGNDVQRRLAEGTPPTAFQANLGGNGLQWAESAQDLRPRAMAWEGAFDPSILERLTVDGKLIGVPLALTRQNNAYYNPKLLSELELDIPVGREGFEAWLQSLADMGYTHPLCIGDEANWVSAHVLFEDIVPAYVGAEYAARFWSGEGDPRDELFGEALDYAASLNGYWNDDFGSIDMAPGIMRLMEARAPAEQCLMTPMGDWGGAILASEYEVDEDFVQRSWPGAESLFVLAGDAFVTTRGVENLEAALDFFDTLASEEGQIAFNAKKGSVPARDLSEEQRQEFGPLTQANMSDFAASAPLAAFKVIGSSDFPFEELQRLTHDFLLAGDKEPLIDFIEAHYAELHD
ncbi:MAG TPA: ABC transporter substrate-binding protein [Polyangiaceae bacterium]